MSIETAGVLKTIPPSGAVAVNFTEFKAGQHDPYLNKYIKILIIHDEKFIVYLDDDLNVQWNISADIITPELGVFLNQVAILESKSDFMTPSKFTTIISRAFGGKSQALIDFFRDRSLLRIRSLLGESIARIFDGNKTEQAQDVLDEAERLISVKNAEYARRWYYDHAAKFVASTFLVALVLWLCRDLLITKVIGRSAFEVIFCSLFGSLGAFIFVARRGQKIELDAISGAMLHKLEADARLATGMAAAAVVNLAIKSNFLFGAIQNSSHLSFMLMASILAGYSERFIPNMVGKFQTSLPSRSSKKP